MQTSPRGSGDGGHNWQRPDNEYGARFASCRCLEDRNPVLRKSERAPRTPISLLSLSLSHRLTQLHVIWSSLRKSNLLYLFADSELINAILRSAELENGTKDRGDDSFDFV